MRRVLAVFLSLLMVLIMASTGFAAERSIRVLVDETELQFDAEPFMENSRTLVPVRALAEKLGFVVGWDEADQRVTLTRGETVIELWIGSTKVMVNGQESQIDVAPTKMNDRTFVPVRFVSEQLGTHVGWDDKNWAVKVTSGQGLLHKLSKQQNQQTDGKLYGDVLVGVTMPHPQVPGETVSVDVPVHTEFHLYGNEMLQATTAPIMPGLEIKYGTALKGGVLYVNDGMGWQAVGTLDPSKPALPDELGGMDVTELVKLSESMLKDVSVKVGRVATLDGVQLVRTEVDMSRIPMDEMIGQIAAMVGVSEDAQLDVTVDRFLLAAWVNPVNGHAPKTEIDMAVTLSMPNEDGSTETMSLTIVGSVLSKQVSEPIAWPEGL